MGRLHRLRFTGEEELSVSGLVHLNGRVYDPLLARMTSPDPSVSDPMNAQSWNRYSYVGNDPLTFTDPNGFSWFSNFFHSVVNFFARNPIVRAVVQIVATVVLAIVLTPVAVAVGFATAASTAASIGAAALSASIVTGLSGGNLGQILRAGAIAGATAFGFAEVGALTPGAANPLANPAAYIENVAGHALIGCASSAASGGSCASGALSAGISDAAGPFINGSNQAASLISNAVVGGLASVAGGGKFANGAVTGAFGYLVSLGPVSGSTDSRMNAYDAAPEEEELEPKPLEEEVKEDLDPNYRGGLDYGPWRAAQQGASNPNVCTVDDPLGNAPAQWPMFSDHAAVRMSERGVTEDMVETAINQGQQFYDPKNGSNVYVLQNGFASGSSLTVATNPISGRVNTVIVNSPSSNPIRPRYLPYP